MEAGEAWVLIIVWFIFPIFYVFMDKNAGNWIPPKTSGCPFSPRIGWLVIILFLGLIGLAMLIYKNQKLKCKKMEKKVKI